MIDYHTWAAGLGVGRGVEGVVWLGDEGAGLFICDVMEGAVSEGL